MITVFQLILLVANILNAVINPSSLSWFAVLFIAFMTYLTAKAEGHIE